MTTCAEWYKKTSSLIREEKWSEVKQSEDCGCWMCARDFYEKFSIEKMFIKEGKFCKEAQEAALYLNFGQKLDWVEAIVSDVPLSMENLRNVVESGLVDVNTSGLAGSFLNYQSEYWMEALEYLFSKGCSVDIQDDNGYSLLMSANRWNDYDHQMSNFLLEHGADPLLEDKEGYTMVSYAKEYFLEEDQERFFGLIREASH